MARRPLLLLVVAAAALLLAAPQAEAQSFFRDPLRATRDAWSNPVRPAQPNPVQANPAYSQSNRGQVGMVNCNECTQTYKNPVTGAAISCTCYYNVQNPGAQFCQGAKFGQASQMYYRDC
jgi:hypothetical protein